MDFIESILAGKANSALSILQEELKRKTLEAVQEERLRVVSETFGGIDEDLELSELTEAELPKVHEHKIDHALAGELYHHALYDHNNAIKNGHPGGGNLHQWADNYRKKMKKGVYDEKKAVHGLTHAIKRTEQGYLRSGWRRAHSAYFGGPHAHKPNVSYSTRHAAATRLLPHVHNLIHGKDLHHGIDESTVKTGENLQEVLIHGKKLTPQQHNDVLNAFVHRHTGEHKPNWAKGKMPNGNTVKPTHATDKEWVHDHAFHFNKKTGRLSAKHQHAEPGFMAEAMTSPKHVIRKGSLSKDEYLQHDGTFGAHATAKRFGSSEAADAHAEKHLGHLKGNYGVFPVSKPRQMKEASPAMAPQQAAPPRPPKMKEPAKAGKTGKFGKWSDNEEDRLPWPSDYGKRQNKSAISGFSEDEAAPAAPAAHAAPRSQPYEGPFPRKKHSHRCKGCQRRNGQGAVACYKSHCTRPQLSDTCSWCKGA